MKLRELKNQLLTNSLQDQLIIFVCKDNFFIADQYIEKICELKHCDVNKISSLSEINNSALSLVFDYETDLNILHTEVFSEFIEDYSQIKNCVIVCNKIENKLKDLVENYVVEIPALLDWQIKAYIATVCPGLDSQYIDWLYTNTKGDIYKITNELDKIKLFSKDKQLAVGTKLKFEPTTDLYVMPIFDLSNAIINKDKRTILDYLWHQEVCDIEPIALTQLLLGNFKKSLLINYNSGLNAQEIGVSPAQYNYLIRHSVLSEKFLTKAIKFLSEVDYKIKSGQYDIPKQVLTNYILCKIVSLQN